MSAKPNRIPCDPEIYLGGTIFLLFALVTGLVLIQGGVMADSQKAAIEAQMLRSDITAGEPVLTVSLPAPLPDSPVARNLAGIGTEREAGQ